VQAPVLALIWGLLALPLYWRDRRLRAGVLTALITLAGLLVLIMSASAYALLPSTFKQVQFAYRLQTYVTLACAGLVLLGTLALTRRKRNERATSTDRGLQIGLGLVIAFSLALSAWQLWVPTTHIYEGYFSSYTNRAEALSGPPTILPESWNAGNNYSDLSLPIVPTSTTVTFDPATLGDDRLSGSGKFPPGVQPFATNISGGPYFVHVGGGVRVVGRTAQGYLALQRTAKGSGPIPFELRAQSSAPVVLGRIVTGASAALLLLALAFATTVAAMRRWRRRSAGHA
ncbi:MAG TPA: hypothetical protein VNW92_16920, partial [Polyangiaceae bacterium]|nr:hypothetical protein [Polyangiaceae bacterium]